MDREELEVPDGARNRVDEFVFEGVHAKKHRVVMNLGLQMRQAQRLDRRPRPAQHVLDGQPAQPWRTHVRFELDEESEHLEGERAVSPGPAEEAPTTASAHVFHAGQVALLDAQIDVADRSLPGVSVEKVRGEDALHWKDVDAHVGASRAHLPERQEGMLMPGPFARVHGRQTRHSDRRTTTSAESRALS